MLLTDESKALCLVKRLGLTCSGGGAGIGASMIIMTVECLVFLPLAWYLQQILPSALGVRRHPLFFLDILKQWRTHSTLPEVAPWPTI